MQKIKTIEELLNLDRAGKTVVLCHGVWDLVHPGHIRHLEAAKRQGDILIVTITPDRYVNRGPGRPVFNERLRAESIAALECVDYVAINEWPTAVETIKRLRPFVYVKGSDYTSREADVTGEIVNEENAIKSVGGRIHFTDEITFSSSELINRYLSPYPEEAREFLEDFRRRYSAEAVIKMIKDLKELKVLVVGDTIIDEYCYCQGLGKTPKDNIIAVKYLSQETFAGGVLAAANHLAGFCDSVDLVTCLGRQNNYEQFILSHLKTNIKVKFFYHENGPTVVKRRFIDPAFLAKMFELTYIDDHSPASLYDGIGDYLAGNAKDYDLVLVTDFGHGFINREIAGLLCNQARFLAVNTQLNAASAGFNLITKYARADYICLDELELRLAYHDKHSTVENLVDEMTEHLSCRRIAITRGHLGSLTCQRQLFDTPSEFFRIPAFSTNVVDRTGAGDAYLSITAPCVSMDYDMELIGFIGNAVGALKVQIIGNKESVEPVPLFKFITALLK